jgi:hypothetical protein
MPIYSSVDECRDRLHRAGWSIGETATGPDQALVWLVTGTKGENLSSSPKSWRSASMK